MKVAAKYNKSLFFNPRFYFFGFLALTMPAIPLRKLLDVYKQKFMNEQKYRGKNYQ